MGKEYLGSGTLQEIGGTFELELLEPTKANESIEDYRLGELLPESYQYLGDGGIALGTLKFKPFPETLRLIDGATGSGYLLLGCSVKQRQYVPFASGPIASKKTIEVRHIIILPCSQLSLPRKGYGEVTYSRISCSEMDDWLYGRNHALRFLDSKNKEDPLARIEIYRDTYIKIGKLPWNLETLSADILIHTDANAHAKPATVNVRQRNYFEVHSNEQLSVDEHLRIQRAFIALVELACSRRITSVLIEVSHLHDLALLPDKKTRYHNRRKVLAYEFGSKKYLEQKDAGRRNVFTFSDIRDKGVIKWFHLLEDYPSAMYPMINLFENEDYLTPEIQILLCGVVIENLEFSLSKKKATFQKYVDWLLDDL